MCMIGEITYIDDLQNFDQYNDDYVLQTKANLVEQSTVGFWEEVQFQQLENSDQPMHIYDDRGEENAENFEISEGYLPLCFASFQFLKEIFSKIRNQQSFSFDVEVEVDNELLEQVVNEKTSPEMVEEIVCDIESSLAPDLQPQNSIECQVADEGLEIETYDQTMQDDSVPLCFEAFQFLKQNFHNISKEKDGQAIECHAVSLKPMDTFQQSFKFFMTQQLMC